MAMALIREGMTKRKLGSEKAFTTFKKWKAMPTSLPNNALSREKCAYRQLALQQATSNVTSKQSLLIVSDRLSPKPQGNYLVYLNVA